MSNVRPHALVESKTDGLQAIKLLEEPYSGIIFSYGKVTFDADEENDTLHLKFEYDIHDRANKVFDETVFENYLGDFLQELIHDGIEKNSIAYTGGVDENRPEDSEQSDL